MLDRRLKGRDLQVLCVFGRHTDKQGWCRRSQVAMAREMDCARSTVQASINRLVAAGWLDKKVLSAPHEPGRRDSAHDYRVIIDVFDDASDPGPTPAEGSAPLPLLDRHPPAAHQSAPINAPCLTVPVVTKTFERFWGEYPHKVGKREAEKAFANAIKRAPIEDIIVGLRQYAAKTDDRPWCNPSTFLNQDRWCDAPAAPVSRISSPKKMTQGNIWIDEARERGLIPHEHAGQTIDISTTRFRG
ncbi:helix-turn-helix domain-containing protein [Phyllobacterium sp. P5_D12]